MLLRISYKMTVEWILSMDSWVCSGRRL